MRMKRAVRAKWVAELRSGKYKQGRSKLHQRGQGTEPDQFCCLGVLCHMAVVDGLPLRVVGDTYGDRDVTKYGGEISLPPEYVKDWAGWDEMGGSAIRIMYLANANDDGHTFAEIATMIEQDPDAQFDTE